MLVAMGRDEMRAADADRQRVADRLRAALDEGRLDLHEYDERLQRAYAAKTYGDLDRLLDDLPGTVPAAGARLARVPPGAAVVAGQPRVHPAATRRWLVDTWDDYLGVVAFTVGIWAVICLMSKDLLYFWPGWVAGPWGIVLLISTITGLASGEPQRWAEKQERKEIAKAEKRARLERDGTPDADEGAGA